MGFLSEQALQKKRRYHSADVTFDLKIKTLTVKESTPFDDSSTFNLKVANILNAIADLLEEDHAPLLQIKSYRCGANIAEHYPSNLSTLSYRQLLGVNGLGNGFARIIIEIARTGSCSMYKRAQRSIAYDEETLQEIGVLMNDSETV